MSGTITTSWMGLTEAEQGRLQALEKMLEREARSFVDKGLALKEIRDAKLYRDRFDAFEKYCQERWQLSRPRIYQLIAAAEVAGNLSTMVDILQPVHERPLRGDSGGSARRAPDPDQTFQ